MNPTIASTLRSLRGFTDATRRGRIRSGNAFVLCLRASFAKAYDFALFSHGRRAQGAAFFITPTLRGICEDLILLGAISKMNPADRQSVVADLIARDVLDGLSVQANFFRSARPFQQILSPSADHKPEIAALEASLVAVWQRHGWPKLQRGAVPQIRQVAEKLSQPVLTTLYDFLYRATSAMVHFSPGILLRSGWGHTTREFTFASKNFDEYYLLICRTYAPFMFVLYFELFERYLRPPDATKRAVSQLRALLRTQHRWPEVVTYEEMNMEPQRLNILVELARASTARYYPATTERFLDPT